jgi:hypothetical protein
MPKQEVAYLPSVNDVLWCQQIMCKSERPYSRLTHLSIHRKTEAILSPSLGKEWKTANLPPRIAALLKAEENSAQP